jgi:putative acetyltransferase
MDACRELALRPYRPNDLDAVIAIFLGSIRRIAARDYDEAQIDAWARVERDRWAVARLCRPTWVAVIADERVGFADLEPDGHLDMMYVHPAHQRKGVATALLAKVEAAAAELDLPRIFTEASITARTFFERRGFSVVTPQIVRLQGQSLTNFLMEKPIP